MSALRPILILVLLTCNAQNLFSQLVNIETSRMQTDSIRYAGNANLSYNYQRTNDVSLNAFKASLSTQLKTKNLKNIFLFLGNYDIARSNTAAGSIADNSTINNSGFGHFRYNYKFNKWLRWEAYTQLQFNELLSLKYRYLAGTGARFKLNHGQIIKTYLGISSFYEYEQIQDIQQTVNKDVRMSNYIVISIKFPKERGEFTSTTYYQPLFRQLSDYRLTNQSLIQLTITKQLSFTTSVNYFFDFNPPSGVQQSTFSINNGLRFTF